jgi:DNA-binding HxlR family transcriptional regulator
MPKRPAAAPPAAPAAAPTAALRAAPPALRSTRRAAGSRVEPGRRSPCPVACTLDLIGDRWTLLVVRDLFAGRTRFAEFARAPEGIASNILAQRLDALVAAGLVERRGGDGDGHPRYGLTERGRSLRPVLEALRDWGLAQVEGTRALVDVPTAPGPEPVHG